LLVADPARMRKGERENRKKEEKGKERKDRSAQPHTSRLFWTPRARRSVVGVIRKRRSQKKEEEKKRKTPAAARRHHVPFR